MKSDAKATTTKGLEPLKIRQAFVALELGATDGPILDYLNFLTNEVPTSAAYFLHVLPKFDLFNTMFEQGGESLISNFELNDEVIRRMSHEIKENLTKRNAIYVEFDVKEGDPLEELLEDAEEVNADLAVIGQKTGAARHGILAKNLARKTKCNALIVPDSAKPQLKKIMVPVDFSLDSVKALQTAIRLNAQLSEPAEIVCVNVYEMPNLSIYKIQKTQEQFKKMIEADRQAAFKNFLEKYAADASSSISTVLLEKQRPGIANYLYDYATDNAIDLVVIGAQGHSNVELMLLGSVTEKFLALNEEKPTLVVKRDR
jgi:nucleotide-binding universal stress UspA family protein